MPKCLLCFSEDVGQINDDDADSEWGCFDCGAFGPNADDISSPAIDHEQSYRPNGQVDRILTDDPEDAHHGWT